MRKQYTLLFSVLCLPILLFCQPTVSFSGSVNGQYELPLAGVHILNLSDGEHAHSNEDGNFSFSSIAQNDSLQFSYIGYETALIVLEDLDKPLSIQLQEIAIDLETVIISPNIDALKAISAIDLYTSPVNSSQDILRQVPGLFIGQHAGGGKAEQLFLRGFDIDHGTDVAISVDGMPVNMVSHAHGQGYADLHFVIPETVQNIDFGKGLYYAQQGNFNTAGYVQFNTKTQLDQSLLKVETGQFNSNRLLGMFDLLNNENQQAYLATEYTTNDGPFDSPQHFNRINLLSSYQHQFSEGGTVRVLASHFRSKWDASGQIPERAIQAGSIGRFGAIDDTEGGNTSRSNILFDYKKQIDDHSFIKNTAYFSQYDFELYSNFTFFLNDPVNGDQIKQHETRQLFGFQSAYQHDFDWGLVNGIWQAGVGLRHDQSFDNELSRTANRSETLEEIQLGTIHETNLSAYTNANFYFGDWTINPVLRFDRFDFQYQNALQINYETQSTQKAIISPKLNLFYNPSRNLQYYLKLGKGFHSNDTRVVLEENSRSILPAAYGADLGFIWKPRPRLFFNATYWHLFLEQEFVYVGDEGVVEPSGETQRQGLELNMRYQAADWLFFQFDANYTHARAINEEAGEDLIPLAPDFTLMSSVRVIHPSGIYGGASIRHLKNRPANEDNSIVAEGYTIVDCNIGYAWKQIEFGIQVQNLLNTDWNETQFATTSRLQNEATSVEEIHFTPGTPFFLKGVVAYRF